MPSILQEDKTTEEIEALKANIISGLDPYVYIMFFTPFVSNPFIYVFSNRSYRKAYKDFFVMNIIQKIQRSVDDKSKSMEMAVARYN